MTNTYGDAPSHRQACGDACATRGERPWLYLVTVLEDGNFVALGHGGSSEGHARTRREGHYRTTDGQSRHLCGLRRREGTHVHPGRSHQGIVMLRMMEFLWAIRPTRAPPAVWSVH